MPTLLNTDAIEGSTYIIAAAFTDENGGAVTPDAATWTLTDPVGNVVNNREDVAITPLSSSVNIVLKGDDLSCPGDRDRVLILTVKGTYTSSIAGAGTPFVARQGFRVKNVPAIGGG